MPFVRIWTIYDNNTLRSVKSGGVSMDAGGSVSVVMEIISSMSSSRLPRVNMMMMKTDRDGTVIIY